MLAPAAHAAWIDYAQADTSASATTVVLVSAVGTSAPAEPGGIVTAGYTRWDTGEAGGVGYVYRWRADRRSAPLAGRPRGRVRTDTAVGSRAMTTASPRFPGGSNRSGMGRPLAAPTTPWRRRRRSARPGWPSPSTAPRPFRWLPSGRAITSAATSPPPSDCGSPPPASRAGTCASARPTPRARRTPTSASPTTASERRCGKTLAGDPAGAAAAQRLCWRPRNDEACAMFEPTIAGSLPKPGWLAETQKLWPQWKRRGPRTAAGQARCHAAVDQGAGGRRAGHHRRRRTVAASTSSTASSSRSRASTSSTRSRWASATTATRRWCRRWWRR